MRISDWSSDVCSSYLHDIDRARVEVRRQAVDLVAVEHGVGAQHAARLVGSVPCDDGFDGLAIGFIEDGNLGAFAFAHLAAKSLRLLVCHPGARIIPDRKSTRLNSSH